MGTYTITKQHTGISLLMYFIGAACLLAGLISFVLFLFFTAYISQFPSICCTATMAFSFVLSIIAFIIGVSAKKTKLTDDGKEKNKNKNEKKEEEKPKFPEKNPIIVDAEIVEEKSEKKR